MSKSIINWHLKHLDELSVLELFEILKLRQNVFVVEQECAYPDIDKTDLLALHLFGTIDNGAANSGSSGSVQDNGSSGSVQDSSGSARDSDATRGVSLYARLIKPGVTYEYASIGRVIVAPVARGKDYGRTLMQRAISDVETHYPGGPIKIGAQERLENFYTSLGFKRTSEMYLEDGIPHIDMLRAFSHT